MSHNLAATTDRYVKAWGYNANGQLGDGTTTNRTTPIAVPNLTGVVQVSAGYAHSLALKKVLPEMEWVFELVGEKMRG